LVSGLANGRRFIIGRNELLLRLARCITISGIVDDFYNENEWEGISVVKTQGLPKGSFVINCSTSISPVKVHSVYSKFKNITLLGYYELLHSCPEKFPVPEFVRDTRSDFDLNKPEWYALLKSLKDQESKQTLFNILRFRLSADYMWMEHYDVRLAAQYLESFMNYNQEIFVDAGGFTGDTSEAFIKKDPEFEKIYLFEPSKPNVEDARERLKAYLDTGKIEFFECGLSNKKETLIFDQDAGSASNVSASGGVEIKADKLDSIIDGKVTFIKMDLEGWEQFALEGSRECIEKNHPKLALAVYHKTEDFWQIKNLFLSIRSDYDIYLRHYTQGWSETIMYFLPKKNG
jgi:FkbM family methyltransferase